MGVDIYSVSPYAEFLIGMEIGAQSTPVDGLNSETMDESPGGK